MNYWYTRVAIIILFVLFLDILSFYVYGRSIIGFFGFYPRILLHDSLKNKQILYQEIAVSQRSSKPPSALEIERMREDHKLCFSVADCIDDPNQLASETEVSNKNKYYCKDRQLCEGNDCSKAQVCSYHFANVWISYHYTCRENKCEKKKLLVTDPRRASDPWVSLLRKFIRPRHHYYGL